MAKLVYRDGALYHAEDESDSLAHYGVPGMKKGVRARGYIRKTNRVYVKGGSPKKPSLKKASTKLNRKTVPKTNYIKMKSTKVRVDRSKMNHNLYTSRNGKMTRITENEQAHAAERTMRAKNVAENTKNRAINKDLRDKAKAAREVLKKQREQERIKKAAQREADKAKRDQERAAKKAEREAAKAARAAKASSKSKKRSK